MADAVTTGLSIAAKATFAPITPRVHDQTVGKRRRRLSKDRCDRLRDEARSWPNFFRKIDPQVPKARDAAFRSQGLDLASRSR